MKSVGKEGGAGWDEGHVEFVAMKGGMKRWEGAVMEDRG